jgi:hypothetical protein
MKQMITTKHHGSLLTVVLLLYCLTGTSAKNMLYLSKPNGTQHKTTIQKAELNIKPLGAYVEYTLNLQVGRNTAYSKYYNSNLEMMFYFELDEYTFIKDAKYWRNDEVYDAEIRSRLTSVNASGDPYFKLIRESDEQYLLTMYPLRVSDMKQFQISYLSPARIQDKQLLLDVPLKLLFAADDPPAELIIRVFKSENYKNPVLSDPAIKWKTDMDESDGPSHTVHIKKPTKEQLELKLELTKPDEVQYSIFEDESGGYFALLAPVSLLIKQSEKPRNTCYLFDIIPTEQMPYIPVEELMELCIQGLEHQAEGSKFNVIYGGFKPEMLSKTWINLNPVSLRNALRTSALPSYSNLNNLLLSSIEFINSQGGDGEIVLFTNNKRYRANDLGLADELRQKLQEKIPIQIIDCAQNIEHYEHSQDVTLVNSAMFYKQLASNEGSSFSQLIEWDTWRYGADYYRHKLLEIIHRSSGTCADNVTIQSNNKKSAIFAEFYPNNLPGKYYLGDDYFLSIGRYNGKNPSDFLVNFEIDQLSLSKSLEVMNVDQKDSLLKIIWSEYHLGILEKNENTFQMRSDIVNEMLDLGILGKYTAYMSIDWGETLCINCFDLINEPLSINDQLKVSPNPFSDYMNIDTKIGANLLLGLKIYNIMGQLIRTFSTNSFQHEYQWDGRNDNGNKVKSGTYLLVANYQSKTICTKVLFDEMAVRH